MELSYEREVLVGLYHPRVSPLRRDPKQRYLCMSWKSKIGNVRILGLPVIAVMDVTMSCVVVYEDAITKNLALIVSRHSKVE